MTDEQVWEKEGMTAWPPYSGAHISLAQLHSRVLLKDEAVAILPWESSWKCNFSCLLPLHPSQPLISLLFFSSESILLINHLYPKSLSQSVFLRTEDWWLLARTCWEVESAGSPLLLEQWPQSCKVHHAPECGRKWSCLHRISHWLSCMGVQLGTWRSSNCHKKMPTLNTSRMMD